ncbi:MAG: YqeG family HAD IIIA-type phosphatase [Clostridia bacterium]|nr:YqeG family HAD IIIA-type phosphatase [Clostridia bacterium]
MLKNYYPYEYVESVFKIDYKKLYEKGYRGIIFDIDNTLVPHGKPSTPEVDELFKNIQEIGFKTFILSDNGKKRINEFLKNIDCPYIDNAGKPKINNYIKAVESMKLDKKEVIYIGDQTFTDILGANRAGIDNILVKFIGYYDSQKIGIKRNIEKIILKFYNRSKKYKNRLGGIEIKGDKKMKQKKKKLFCERNQLFFKLAVQKGIVQRNIKDLLSKEKFAKNKNKKKKQDKLPNLISSHSSYLIKKGTEVNLQENKVVNVNIASSKINNIIIHPGETFSYWRTIGTVNKRKGYMEGRVLRNNKLQPGMGGGLCNLANTINLVVLNSPLKVTEFHTHSDALAPDYGERKPLENGTCVGYNYIDYRFKNTTDQDIQLLVWVENKTLYAELRSEKEFPYEYELFEENHHFKKEGDNYYRNSKIYRNTIEKSTGNITKKELIWDNHSKVMYDFKLIPKELIKE